MILLNYRISGGDFDSAGLATRMLKEQLARAGVGASAMRRVMIASYEAEMNVVIHARTGTLWARLDGGKLDLEIADEGPGIPDVELALREGWSTASEHAREMGFGAGMGLPNIRRNSDLFEVETRVGRGTRIRSTILLAGAQIDSAPAGAVVTELVSPAVVPGRCISCMRCLPACPVSALRVRDGGPSVIPALCVGCAECGAACGAGVFGLGERNVATDSVVQAPPDAVLVLPRGFLAGFPIDNAPARVLSALETLGFSEVRLTDEWERALLREARGAGRGAGPLIPPFCSAVVTLIESRFPSLIPQLGAWVSPAEAAGEEFPLRPVVLVAACPGQYAAARRASLTARLTVLAPEALASAVRPLLSAGGACASRFGTPEVVENARESGELTVQGARHVLRVLSEAEAGRLGSVPLLNLRLCEGGCSGSPFLTPDSFLSEHRWRLYSERSGTGNGSDAGAVTRSRPYRQRPGVRLDPDMRRAMQKLSRIDALLRALPGRDCGACGAPTCAAFAEDLVMERAGDAKCPHVEEKQ